MGKITDYLHWPNGVGLSSSPERLFEQLKHELIFCRFDSLIAAESGKLLLDWLVGRMESDCQEN